MYFSMRFLFLISCMYGLTMGEWWFKWLMVVMVEWQVWWVKKYCQINNMQVEYSVNQSNFNALFVNGEREEMRKKVKKIVEKKIIWV